jgi:hypothetical protein
MELLWMRIHWGAIGNEVTGSDKRKAASPPRSQNDGASILWFFSGIFLD